MTLDQTPTLWTAAQAARELGYQAPTMSVIAQRRSKAGDLRLFKIGNYWAAVPDWWRENALPRKRISAEAKIRAQALRADGHTAWDIARILRREGVQISEGSVYRICQDLPDRNDSLMEKISEALDDDKTRAGLTNNCLFVAEGFLLYRSQVEAANSLGITRSRVGQILDRVLTVHRQVNSPDKFRQLSVRAYNALQRAGIATVDEILAKGFDGVLAIRNVGKRSAAEIWAFANQDHGMRQGKEPNPC